MPIYTRNDTATSNVLAWTAHAANGVEEDAGAEADEPPDSAREPAKNPQNLVFQKTVVHRSREHAESLLTRALQSQSEDETADQIPAAGIYQRRRRSITSNTSLASTAGFTSDTGITTPPRTNSPSPRLAIAKLAISATPKGQSTTRPSVQPAQPTQSTQSTQSTVEPAQPAAAAAPRKRCISFACGPLKPSQAKAKPTPPPTTSTKTPGPDDTPKAAYAQLATPEDVTQVPNAELPAQPKRSCIRFVCPARPATDARKPQESTNLKVDEQRSKLIRRPSPAPEAKSPASIRKHLRNNSSASSARSPRPANRIASTRQPSHSPVAVRAKKYYNAAPSELNGESSRFHGFASDSPLEDDWIRQEKATYKNRLTIDDTLQKELAIRRLGKEAEEEAEQEENEENDDDNNDVDEDEDEDADDNDDVEEDDEDEDDEDEEDEDDDDVFEGYSSGEGASDGYKTDNETGFASSDEEDDGLVLWTVNRGAHQQREYNNDTDHTTLHQAGTPVFRRLSVDEHSDSSDYVAGLAMRQEMPKHREITRRTATPELPDSTDFVCGTFDEDRPLEEAYLTHIKARKHGKLHVIPQDIDPSFPTSDPEDNSDNEAANYKKHRAQQQNGSADDRIWEMEDIHHDQQDRDDRRSKKKPESPRRYRSPPPPKNRGRSPAPRAPRRLFDRHSPTRRLKSPAPKAMPVAIVPAVHTHLASPPTSPVEEADGRGLSRFRTLAFKPGLTQTKSLPRPSAIFRHQTKEQQAQAQPKPGRRTKANGAAGAKQTRHVRGAIDIVKGLEQKRQRRKDKFQQKYCNRARKGQVPERRTQRGEGAERMREVGLLMAGKIPVQGHYVLSV
ncbi:hypothetical protein F503_07923 [Ophiostoma piceae UAMH 11346]|uniref:Uncharacterized protein n=1 Tax=Ophiostoma piceae (strain UAMH 11346) TaxID=1262450 RepID=S3C3C6_OPHP1|nr:hypothetical protein F503_07923 [Ophiostoma piceae UAMH 11346]